MFPNIPVFDLVAGANFELGDGPTHLNIQFDEPLLPKDTNDWLSGLHINPPKQVVESAKSLSVSGNGVIVIGHDRGTLTASEIAKYEEDELLARTIINSVVGGDGFMFRKNVLEVVGQGTDYLPLWSRGYRILGVYENSELVYDLSLTEPAIAGYTYGITTDQAAIYKDEAGMGNYNRAEKKPLEYRKSVSDSFNAYSALDTPTFSANNTGVMFPEGVDYVIVYETGYKVVPNDIRDATLRLMDDIRCGKLDYYKRAIESYQTDQFTIKWDKRHLEGTGNLIVDKTLEKYTTTLRKPWVI
jgi:hypothetical protein